MLSRLFTLLFHMVPTPLSLQRMSQVPVGLLPSAQQPRVLLSRTAPQSRQKPDPRVLLCCASGPAVAQEAQHPTLASIDDLNRVMSLGTQQPGGAAALGRSTLSELLRQQGKECGSAVLTSRLIAQAAYKDLDEVIPA